MPRKSHRKSRAGCGSCKKRHLKCDETKPRCINCITAHVRCPYEDERPVSRSQGTTPTSQPDEFSFNQVNTSQSDPTSRTTGIFQNDTIPQSTSTATSPAVNSLTANSATSPGSISHSGHELNMLHLELLHWWMSGSYKSFLLNTAEPELFANTCIKHGLQHHFFMRQILATSALHLSIVRPDKRAFYHHHATQLQAEAVADYNTVLGKLDESNILAAFLFSSLTGLHVFCDTFTFGEGEPDFNDILDSLVSCINLLRGVRAVIGTWWIYLLNSEISPILLAASAQREQNEPHHFEELTTLIAEADIGPSSREAYQAAIKELERVSSIQAAIVQEIEGEELKLDGGEKNIGASANQVFAWLTTVPKEYVDLLAQRRPEALIILSYYAVLLHRRRGFWAVGNSGAVLIDGISSHLGKHWEKWLLGPNSFVAGTAS